MTQSFLIRNPTHPWNYLFFAFAVATSMVLSLLSLICFTLFYFAAAATPLFFVFVLAVVRGGEVPSPCVVTPLYHMFLLVPCFFGNHRRIDVVVVDDVDGNAL
jgi:hypothetical protein